MRRLWLASLAVFAVDQATKALAWAHLSHTTPMVVPGADWARLVAVKNEGLILGFLSGSKSLVVFVMAFAVLNLQAYLSEETGRNPRSALLLPAGLVLGGALGNLVDRMTRGYVVDFVALGSWPVFNVADAAVVTGIVLMVVASFRRPAPAPD